jgi:hypothetical protein
MAIIMFVLDFGAAGRGRPPPAVGTERVVDCFPPLLVGGGCFGTGPVAGLPAGAFTAGWPSRVEPRPGRCVAMLDPFRSPQYAG